MDFGFVDRYLHGPQPPDDAFEDGALFFFTWAVGEFCPVHEEANTAGRQSLRRNRNLLARLLVLHPNLRSADHGYLEPLDTDCPIARHAFKLAIHLASHHRWDSVSSIRRLRANVGQFRGWVLSPDGGGPAVHGDAIGRVSRLACVSVARGRLDR